MELEQYIDFVIGKNNFKTLEAAGMPYFKEIKQFIHVIKNKKEKLVKITGFKALKVPKKINYNVKEIENFIEELKEALDSSQKQKKLILFLSETFWKEMTQVLGKPSDDNIYYLF